MSLEEHISLTVEERRAALSPTAAAGSAARRIFLLSPANMAGVRGDLVLSGHLRSDLAMRLGGPGATLGELFSFVSGLYFRGKLAYAQAFASTPSGETGVLVITACAGLVPADTVVTLDRVRQMCAGCVDSQDKAYRLALDRDCLRLSQATGHDSQFILLGSIATPKYVDPLLEIFGERLFFPAEFVGRGDMSRGGLMLRCVEDAVQLTYIRVANAIRRGPRPAKLARRPTSKR